MNKLLSDFSPVEDTNKKYNVVSGNRGALLSSASLGVSKVTKEVTFDLGKRIRLFNRK